MTLANRQSFLDLFQKLGIQNDDTVGLSGLFTGSLYILSRCAYTKPTIRDIQNVIAEDEFVQFARDYSLRGIFLQDTPASSFYSDMAAFCSLISGIDLAHQFHDFYNAFLPFWIHDWVPFDYHFSRAPFDAAKAIHLILLQAVKSTDITELRDALDENATDMICRMTGLDYFALQDLLNACFLSEIPSQLHSLSVRSAIKDSVSAARRRGMSALEFMHDYFLLQKYIASSPSRRKKDNRKSAREYTNSQLKHLDAKTELDEEYFNKLSVLFQSRDVCEVAHRAFSELNDDSSLFESSFWLREIFARAPIGGNILIVNPSPSFLYRFAQVLSEDLNTQITPRDLYQYHITFCVESDTWKCMYQWEESCVQAFGFITLDDLSSHQNIYDSIFLVARDLPLSRIQDCFRLCRENTSIIALLPQTYLSSSAENIISLFRTLGIHPTCIVDIPSEFSETAPKKKMLLYAQKGSPLANGDIALSFGENLPGRLLQIPHTPYRISIDNLSQGKTLAQIRNDLLAPEKTATLRSSARVYHFSQDISIQYVLLKRANRLSAKAYYRSIVPSKMKHRKSGPKLTPFTEKGLQGSSVHDIESNLELVPFYPDFERVIIDDIIECCNETQKSLSLKTIWFCCLPELRKRIAYDDQFVRHYLFIPENQEALDIVPGQCGAEHYESIIAGNNHVREQLQLILSVAQELGFVDANPFFRISEDSAKERSIESSILSPLKKHMFSSAEESKIVSYFFQRKSPSSHPRFVFDSNILAVAIRLFTGMSVREICSLQWKHFCCVDDLDFYQFLVIQTMNNQGEIITNVNYQSTRSHRKIPCCTILANMLNERKNYLCEKYGYSADDLRNEPIVLKNEYAKKNAKGDRCPISQMTKLSRAVLQYADIPRNEVQILDQDQPYELDLNQFNGDKFRANLRGQAIVYGKLTDGELSYIAGTKPAATADQNYIDYSNSFIQFRIHAKLNRWTQKYLRSYYPQDPVCSYVRYVIPAESTKETVVVDSASMNTFYAEITCISEAENGNIT